MTANYDCPHVGPSIGSPQFTGNPDLIFLRDDLADEIGAIVGYLECAREVKDRRVSRRFREAAQDEAGHYLRLLRMIASLDPVQAEEISKQELSMFLTMGYEPMAMQTMPATQPMPAIQTMNRNCQSCSQYPRYPEEGEEEQPKKHYRPFDRDLECLRNAIRDELHAINAYQRQISATNNPTIQNLLATTMNKEKEHMAEFTKLFYELLHYKDNFTKD